MSRSPIASIVALLFVLATDSSAQVITKPTSPRPPGGSASTRLLTPKGTELDALSRQAFTRWHALEYHLGRAGVKQLSLQIKVDSRSPLGAVQTDGSYTHDGKLGKLSWKNPKLGTMLAERGWSVATFNRWLSEGGLLANFTKSKLTAVKQKDDSIEIKIEGKTRSGHTGLGFDAEGRLAWLTLAVPATVAGEKPDVVKIEMRYLAIGKQVLTTGWKFTLKSKASSVSGETKLTHRTVNGYRVIEKAMETLRVDGKPFGTQVLVFSDHVLGKGKPADEKPKTVKQPGGTG